MKNIELKMLVLCAICILATVGITSHILDKQPDNEIHDGDADIIVVVVYSEPDTLRGDIDCNGKVDTIDYSLARLYINKCIELNWTELMRGDVDGDGDLDNLDYILIRTIILEGTQN